MRRLTSQHLSLRDVTLGSRSSREGELASGAYVWGAEYTMSKLIFIGFKLNQFIVTAGI